MPATDLFVDGGRHPRPRLFVGAGGCGQIGPRVDGHGARQHLHAGECVAATQLGHDHAVTERRGNFARDDDLPALRVPLGLGELARDTSRQHVADLPIGIADLKAAGGARGDRHLDPDGDGHPAGRGDVGKLLHRRLNRDGARDRMEPRRVVEPAGDRVAAERNHAAAKAMDLADQRRVHAIHLPRDFLGAPLQPELARERLRQRREAGDVGGQRGPDSGLRQFPALRQRLPAVHRHVDRGRVGDGSPLLLDVELELAHLLAQTLLARHDLLRHLPEHAGERAERVVARGHRRERRLVVGAVLHRLRSMRELLDLPQVFELAVAA